jgi:hypothetical protein
MLVDENGQPARQLLPLPSPVNIGEAANGNQAGSPATPGDGPFEVHNPAFKAFLTRRQTVAGMNYFDERYGEFWSDADLNYKLCRAGRKLMLLRDVQAAENADGLWRPSSSAAAAFAADRAVGASRFAAKHFSGTMGATLRIGTSLKSLAGLHFGAFTRIVSGQKVDGTEVIS